MPLGLIEEDACDALLGYLTVTFCGRKTLRFTQRFLILLPIYLDRSFS